MANWLPRRCWRSPPGMGRGGRLAGGGMLAGGTPAPGWPGLMRWPGREPFSGVRWTGCRYTCCCCGWWCCCCKAGRGCCLCLGFFEGRSSAAAVRGQGGTVTTTPGVTISMESAWRYSSCAFADAAADEAAASPAVPRGWVPSPAGPEARLSPPASDWTGAACVRRAEMTRGLPHFRALCTAFSRSCSRRCLASSAVSTGAAAASLRGPVPSPPAAVAWLLAASCPASTACSPWGFGLGPCSTP